MQTSTSGMRLTDLNNPDLNSGRPLDVMAAGQSEAGFMDPCPPLRWVQDPPVQMPWGTSRPPLVRFTGGQPHSSQYVPTGVLSQMSSSVAQSPPTFSQPQTYFTCSVMSPQSSSTSPTGGSTKRKRDWGGEGPQWDSGPMAVQDDEMMLSAVSKLRISEERMAAHQQGVHALSQLAEEAAAKVAAATSSVRNIADITDGQRIVLSEEVQMFNQESILPDTILNRMKGPSMALVLWQPPNPRTVPVSAGVEQNSTSSEDEDEASDRRFGLIFGQQASTDQDNNNSSMLDLNHMPSFPVLTNPPVPPEPVPSTSSQPDYPPLEDVDMDDL